MQNGISVPFFNPEGLTALLGGSHAFFESISYANLHHYHGYGKRTV